MQSVWKGPRQQGTLGHLALIIEDLLVRTVTRPATYATVPTLTIDLRGGYLEAFVLSQDRTGCFYAVPRSVRIEEAPYITVARERTPLCAYRRNNSPGWTPCSSARLAQIRAEPGHEAVADIFQYALSLTATERVRGFERLWFSFLSLLTQASSGQDYQRVVFVSDSDEYITLMQATLPRVSSRLDNGNHKRWQEAAFVRISRELDLTPYAFFNKPSEIPRSGQRFLLLRDQGTAFEYRFDVETFTKHKLGRCIDLAQYSSIVAPRVGPVSLNVPGVFLFDDEHHLYRVALMGYLYAMEHSSEFAKLSSKYQYVEQSRSFVLSPAWQSQPSEGYSQEEPRTYSYGKKAELATGRESCPRWLKAGIVTLLATAGLGVFIGVILPYSEWSLMEYQVEGAVVTPPGNYDAGPVVVTETIPVAAVSGQHAQITAPSSPTFTSSAAISATKRATSTPSPTATFHTTPTRTATASATPTQTASAMNVPSSTWAETLTLTALPTATPPPTNSPTASTTPTSTPMIYIIRSEMRINARSCPDLTCAVVTTLLPGTQILVLEVTQGGVVGDNSNWYRVVQEGNEVFVHSSLAVSQP